MHKNGFYLILTVGVGILGLSYLYGALMDIQNYYKYNGVTSATEMVLSPHKIEEDNYGIFAEYSYEVANQEYSRKEILLPKKLLNPWAANQVIDEMAKDPPPIFYVVGDPEYSTLYRPFPMKGLISAFFVIGLTGYFIWLGFYVKKLQQR